MSTPFRVIVTGSRDWNDWVAVETALDETLSAHPSLVVVHGACPSGADEMAAARVRRYNEWPWVGHTAAEERHPADWTAHGKGAGPKRNAEMVAAGADVCLVFIGSCTSVRCRRPEPHGSHGASGCADLAEAAGIETRRWAA